MPSDNQLVCPLSKALYPANADGKLCVVCGLTRLSSGPPPSGLPK